MSSFHHLRNAVIILTVGCGILLLYGYNRSLPQPAPIISFTHETLTPFDKRHVEHIVLHTYSLGDVGLTISLPDPLPSEKLPIVMVLGGLDTGEHNIHNIVNAGNNIIAGFDWPMQVEPPKDASFLLRLPQFYNDAMIAPGQIATAIAWLAAQPAADEKRISILGYSMGALAAPAAQQLSQEANHSVGWTIIAYGGTPFGDILASDRHIQPAWMRSLLAPLADTMLHPLEPDLYLPNLMGRFLILEGKDDSLMPETARARLRDSVPEPKTVIVFEGDHMGVGHEKMKLLEKIIATSREWLTRTKAVNSL